MSGIKEAKRFCAIVQLDKSSDIKRVAQVAPAVVETIKRWSKGEMEMLCRSNDGQLFGYIFKSSKPAGMLRAELEKSTATTNTDNFIVFELGQDFSGYGFTRARTWLQHH